MCEIRRPEDGERDRCERNRQTVRHRRRFGRTVSERDGIGHQTDHGRCPTRIIPPHCGGAEINLDAEKVEVRVRDRRFSGAAVGRRSVVDVSEVAAGVGVTRLAHSAGSIRRTGVVFVPLEGERAQTVMAWHPARDDDVCGRLRTIVSDLAAGTDLSGWS